MTCIGIIGADAEVRDVGSGKAINLSVAVKKDYKDSQGNKVERTEWVRCVIWKNSGKSARIADFLKKGTKVFVEGEPGLEAYSSKEGDPKGSLTLNVKEIELLN